MASSGMLQTRAGKSVLLSALKAAIQMYEEMWLPREQAVFVSCSEQLD